MKRRVALLFPGQGAQAVGMGKSFADHYAIARETFEEANDLLNRNLSKILFEGPAELLTETRNSQTALFVTSFAVWRVLQQEFKEWEPVVAAGFSLGEYSAVAAAGWLPFRDALKLVDIRGSLMQQACEKSSGKMAAIIGLTAQQVEELIRDLRLPNDLWVANYNAPDQIVISGTLRGIEAGVEAAKAKGARRAMPLNVHGAFHSGLMQEAEERLIPHLNEAPFASQGLPLVMNLNAKRTDQKDAVIQNLSQQMTHSVCWEASMRAIEQQGVDLFLEIGCGKVLAGLNKRIGVQANTLSIDAAEDMESLSKVAVG